MLFGDREDVLALLDFDNLRCTYAARDVMRCLELSFPLNNSGALSFFDGYAKSTGIKPDEVFSYVEYWRYISTLRVWPIDARYLEPEHYQSRWDEFIQVDPPGFALDWDRVAHELAGIAAQYQR